MCFSSGFLNNFSPIPRTQHLQLSRVIWLCCRCTNIFASHCCTLFHEMTFPSFSFFLLYGFGFYVLSRPVLRWERQRRSPAGSSMERSEDDTGKCLQWSAGGEAAGASALNSLTIVPSSARLSYNWPGKMTALSSQKTGFWMGRCIAWSCLWPWNTPAWKAHLHLEVWDSERITHSPAVSPLHPGEPRAKRRARIRVILESRHEQAQTEKRLKTQW